MRGKFGRNRTVSTLQVREWYAALVFISPWIIGFFVFFLGPMIASAYLSFTTYDTINPPRWVGLANYSRMFFTDSVFAKSLYNTVYITVIGVPLNILTGLGIALLLSHDVKGITWFRTIFYLPSIVPVVASSILWMWILRGKSGLLNYALSLLGITGPQWLGDPAWAKPAIILMGLWGAGSNMIIYLAGLKNIPNEFYEAASIDGAGSLRQFFTITLPLLTPTLFFSTIMGIIGSFQIFTQSFIMTGGGPNDSTLFYVFYLFNNAFSYFQMGYASALAWVLFFIILACTVIIIRSGKYWVHYEIGERA